MESKRKSWISISLIVFLLGLVNFSCKKGDIPLIKTTEIKDITDVTVLCGGIISSDGGSNIISCGVCWSIDSTNLNVDRAKHTSDSVSNGVFTSTITNLTPLTKYYIKAYATNKAGTGYGRIISLTTTIYVSEIKFNPSVNYGNLVDQDGNTYKTLTIGTQVWMAENLKAITYTDGKPVLDYIWYNNDANTYKANYGALYLDRVLFEHPGTLCPVGWHIPTKNEWDVLINSLGGWTVAGGKLKEEGTIHWKDPNAGATNESGFTALPGGSGHNDLALVCYFGSSTTSITLHAGIHSYDYVYMHFDFAVENAIQDGTDFFGLHGPSYLSIRCIKNF